MNKRAELTPCVARVTQNATFGVSRLGQFASQVDDHAVKGKFVWNF